MGFSLYSLHQYSLTNIVMKNHQAEYDFKFVNFPNWFHSLSEMGRVWLWLNQSNIEYRMNKCQISNEKCRTLYYYLEQKTFDEKSRISHSTFHKINSLFLRFYNKVVHRSKQRTVFVTLKVQTQYIYAAKGSILSVDYTSFQIRSNYTSKLGFFSSLFTLEYQ